MSEACERKFILSFFFNYKSSSFCIMWSFCFFYGRLDIERLETEVFEGLFLGSTEVTVDFLSELRRDFFFWI